MGTQLPRSLLSRSLHLRWGSQETKTKKFTKYLQVVINAMKITEESDIMGRNLKNDFGYSD